MDQSKKCIFYVVICYRFDSLKTGWNIMIDIQKTLSWLVKYVYVRVLIKDIFYIILYTFIFLKGSFIVAASGLETRDVMSWFTLAEGQKEIVTFHEWFTLVGSPVSGFKLSRLLLIHKAAANVVSEEYTVTEQTVHLSHCLLTYNRVKTRWQGKELRVRTLQPCVLVRSSGPDYYSSLRRRVTSTVIKSTNIRVFWSKRALAEPPFHSKLNSWCV